MIATTIVSTELPRKIIKKRLLTKQFTVVHLKAYKWCGVATNATSCDDFGARKEIDICCREHDYCPYVIYDESSESYYGFKYNWNNTKHLVHCECNIK